jgi:hypothetical protein
MANTRETLRGKGWAGAGGSAATVFIGRGGGKYEGVRNGREK